MKRFWLSAGGSFLLLMGTAPALRALPDLAVQSSEIVFTNDSPEITDVITLSATVRNSGGTYHDQVASTPMIDRSTLSAPLEDWVACGTTFYMANALTPSQDFWLSRIDLRIFDRGADDSLRIRIKPDNGTFKPTTGVADVLATVEKNSALTDQAAPVYENFVLAQPLLLQAGITVWFTVENDSTTPNGYGVWLGSGVASNRMAFSLNQGQTSWVYGGSPPGSQLWESFHKVFRPQDTVLRLYQGDPDAGGTLLSASTVSLPLTAGGSAVISTTWSASVAGAYDIYVQVDGPGLLGESDETNNKAFRTVTVVRVAPAISGSSPPDGQQGVDPTVAPTFTFTKAMDAATLAGAFTLRAVRDSEGGALDDPVAGALVWDGASKTVTFTPAAPLSRNHRYETRWTAAALDSRGIALTPRAAVFHTAFSNAARNVVVGDDARTRVVLDPGAVSDADYFVRLEVSPPPTSAVRVANDKASGDRDAFTAAVPAALRRVTLFTGTAPGTAVDSPRFAGDVQLTIPYTDDGRGFVAGTSPPVREENLSVYWLNESDGLWVRLPDSTVDAGQDAVTARVPHFSYFVLMGLNAADLSRAYAYPVPFRPNAGLGHARVKFAGLSPQCVIRVYSVTGELVKTLEESDGDGFNDAWDGSDVPSGAYLYIVDNGSDRKTGELVIIK